MLTVGQLIAKLNIYGDDTPVCVRTIERDEINLTVDVTRVKVEDGQIILVGDLDELNQEIH
jgi:hypothetical protein